VKVLVTGGAGFIGSHLCRRLVADGHHVTAVDNEFNGSRETVPPDAKFVFADVTDPSQVESAFATGFDAVCHLAGQVSIIRSFSDPVADLRTNVEGTLQMLQLCQRYKVPRFIYASSMTAYGDAAPVPTPETQPCLPNSYYGISKHAAERFVHTTAERSDLGFPFRATSLRMFSVFGPGQSVNNPYQGVLGIFIGKIMRGEPITIFGDGEQTRDFVYIDDIVEGWVRALSYGGGMSDVFNLGSGRSLSINQLAASAVAAFGLPPGGHPIGYQPARPGEQRAVRADITEARARLRWEPRTTFEKGLAETVRHARIEHDGSRQGAVEGAPA